LQPSRSDLSLSVVNHSSEPLSNITAQLTLYDLTGVSLHTQTENFNVAASSTSAGDAVKWPKSLPPVYFVKLNLHDDHHNLLSENFYWRSSKTPPDFTALQDLSQIRLQSSVRINQDKNDYVLKASVANPASSGGVAFFIRLKLLNSSERSGTDKRILPAFYEDNYLSLLPGEATSVTIRCAEADACSSELELWVEGWNILPMQVPGFR